MLKRRLRADPGPRPGFTLVEILIAAVVLMLSTIGSTVLFNQATRQGLSGNHRLQEQLAISRDLAAMLDANERYNCNETQGCALPVAQGTPPAPLPAPPDQDAYAPRNADDTLPGGGSFRELCDSGLLTNLLSALEDTGEIERQSSTRTITLAGTHVQRTVSLLDATGIGTARRSAPPHRYRVDWLDAQGQLLRQVQLIPTVAAWCP